MLLCPKEQKGRYNMRWLNDPKMSFMLFLLMVTFVLGARCARAEIIISEPTNVGPVINHASDVQECDFSHDGLELYFSSARPGGYGGKDIWVARRDTVNGPWQEPVNLGPVVNSPGSEVEPSISGDGLELYFGDWNDFTLRVCTRPSKDTPWNSPVMIGPPVGSLEKKLPYGSNDVMSSDISADGLSLYFYSTRIDGGYGSSDIWVAKRAIKDDPWGEPQNLGPNVNSGGADGCPNISTDGLTLVFVRGLHSIWATTRESIDDEWGPAIDLGINISGPLYGPALSPDGSTIYFDASNASGEYIGADIWQVNCIPIVDFNGDGIVDNVDLCTMIDHWHTNNTLCDVAPLPLGDGFVDTQDLIVFAEHLFEEIPLAEAVQ
jgi:hypothetical protein